MYSKIEAKDRAVFLRSLGKSYSEILEEVGVAKSTLSIWLRDVGLAKKQQHRLSQKKIEAGLRGAERRRQQRLAAISRINDEARKKIGNISQRELWWIGISLYWAEGSKEKDGRPGSGVKFSNSDPVMIKVFLKWLTELASVPKEGIKLEIYIHESCHNRISDVINYWSRVTGFGKESFTRIYYKKNKIGTKRKNIGLSYFGLVRISVSASSALNREISAWSRGLGEYYWGVV